MDGYGKRILVVDEDAGCRALVEAQLEHEGYTVQTACDGVAGLDEMRKRRFDAIIVDGLMPDSAASSSSDSERSPALTLPSFSIPEISTTGRITRVNSTQRPIFINPMR